MQRVFFRVVRFPDDCGLISASGEVAVNAVGRDVQRAVFEPADVDVAGSERRVFDLGIGLDPVDTLAVLGPERFWVVHRCCVHLVIFVFVGVGVRREIGVRQIHAVFVFQHGSLQ